MAEWVVEDARAALERLKLAADSGELDAVCERHGVSVLTAFGSAVHDDDLPAHDLDIAVSFIDPTGSDVIALMDDLASLCGPAEIDVMDISRASPVARERALVGVVPLFERESGGFARAQMAAIVQRMDTDWLRRLELDLLAR